MVIDRSGFAKQLVQKYGYYRTDANRIVDEVLETIVDNVKEGNDMAFYGFGSFELVTRKAHKCFNVSRQEHMEVPEHTSLKFSLGSKLKAAVKYLNENGESDD